MLSKSSGNESQLVLCDSRINGGAKVFLDISDHHPMSLFGCFDHSAAISSEGEIIIINYYSVKKSPNSPNDVVSLPDGEKKSSVVIKLVNSALRKDHSIFRHSLRFHHFLRQVKTKSFHVDLTDMENTSSVVDHEKMFVHQQKLR